MAAPKVDPVAFVSRLERLYASWEVSGLKVWCALFGTQMPTTLSHAIV